MDNFLCLLCALKYTKCGIKTVKGRGFFCRSTAPPTGHETSTVISEYQCTTLWLNHTWYILSALLAAATLSTMPVHYRHYTHLTTSFQENPDKLVLKCQTILGFTAATDSIPSLRSGISMTQWISAAISRWECSSDSGCGRSSPHTQFLGSTP